MKQVNTTYWKVFRVGEVFPNIYKPAVYHSREVIEDALGIPYIVRSKFNNGIKCRVNKDGIKINPRGVISFGAENAAFFYQNEEWCSGRDIYYIDTRDLSYYACAFINACLNSIAQKYTYNNGLFPDLLKKEKIKLPSTPDGSPDWKYMEEYMRKIEQRTQNAISAFLASQNKPHKIDTTYWKEFIMEELFEKLDLRFWPKKFEKTKHVSTEKTKEFNIPLVNAKHSNNGIMYYGRETDFESEEMTIDIVADGAASTGDVYPQPQRTGVLYNAYLIKLKERKSSKAVLCFLSTVIERCVKQKFGYDNKCTWDKLKQEKILLPATPAGEPDWRYMEMYMRGVEAIAKEKIALLTKKKQEPVQQTSINNYGTVNIYEK